MMAWRRRWRGAGGVAALAAWQRRWRGSDGGVPSVSVAASAVWRRGRCRSSSGRWGRWWLQGCSWRSRRRLAHLALWFRITEEVAELGVRDDERRARSSKSTPAQCDKKKDVSVWRFGVRAWVCCG